MRFRLLLAGLLGLLLGTAIAADEIPVRHFFEHSKFNEMKLSPDGEHVAFTYEDGSQVKLAVMNLESNRITAGFEFGHQKRVQEFDWASDTRIVMSVYTVVGYLDNRAQFHGLYAADVDGKRREQIFAAEFSNSRYDVLHMLPEDPDHILIAKYHFADGGQPKAHLLNVFDGEIKYVPDQPSHKDLKGEIRWLGADNSGAVRIAIEVVEGETFDENRLIFHAKHGDEWRTVNFPSARPFPDMRPLGFSADNSRAYFLSNHDVPESPEGEANDRLAVFRYNFDTGEIRKIFRHESVDIAGGIFGHDGEVLGVTTVGGYPERIYFGDRKDDSAFLRSLQAAFPGQDAGVTSYSRDGRLAVARVYSDRNPGEFYLFNLETGKARFLAAAMPQLKPESLVAMEPVTIKARDGLELHALLTLPEGEPKNLPLIVNVHGGPFGPFDRWRYNAEAQFFANRGYATLQVNYRGSGNRGMDFMELGWLEWGGAMQDDLTDATRWAIEKGIADPDRICIYGGSYGGYAALQGVVKEPDLYKCAVGYVGVYDLPWFAFGDNSDMYRGSGEQREWAHHFKATRVGSDEAKLRAASPVHNVDKIKAALFLVHGGSDVRVPIGHYERLAEALDKIGKPYESLVVKEEGHGFQNVDNRVKLYTRMLEFFDKHIGAQRKVAQAD